MHVEKRQRSLYVYATLLDIKPHLALLTGPSMAYACRGGRDPCMFALTFFVWRVGVCFSVETSLFVGLSSVGLLGYGFWEPTQQALWFDVQHFSGFFLFSDSKLACFHCYRFENCCSLPVIYKVFFFCFSLKLRPICVYRF